MMLSCKILRELRLEKSLLQKNVAKFLEIETSTYGNYEQGTRQVPDDIKIKLADFYNVSLDYLITGKERDTEYQMPKQSELDKLYSQLTKDEQQFIKAEMIGMLSTHKDKNSKELIKMIKRG